jgi:hypothetical protein
VKRKVSELATVQLGYQHREKIEPASVGTYQVIQAKDVVTEGRFSEYLVSSVGVWTGSLYMVTPKGPAWKYQVEPGDVLFAARGSRNFGIAVDPRWIQPFPISFENILAASHFYILKPNTNRVVPDYLAWCINQPGTQKLLQSMATGSHMKMIPKSRFEELLVDMPPIETQHKIITLHFLAEQERKLVNQISEKRSQIVQAVCHNVASRMDDGTTENQL